MKKIKSACQSQTKIISKIQKREKGIELTKLWTSTIQRIYDYDKEM